MQLLLLWVLGVSGSSEDYGYSRCLTSVSYTSSAYVCKVKFMSTPVKARRRNARGQGARLRDEILDASLRLIDSAAEVTLRAVAREAGIAATSIYGHFADVEQILAAVTARCFDELTAAIHAAQATVRDPVQQLEAACNAYLDYAERRPARYSLLFRRARSLYAAPRDDMQASGGAAFGALVDSVAACAAAGRSSSTDPFADAVALWSALHGLASLRAVMTDFQWPAQDDTARRIIHHLGCIIDTDSAAPRRR